MNRNFQRIRAAQIRVIGADGENLGLMATDDALRKARERGLDLIEVDARASPPVYKMGDLGRHRYEAKKKKRRDKSREMKEIRLRPKTDDHDLAFKTRAAHRMLEDGHSVKLVVRFRGREIVHPEKAREQLAAMLPTLADVAHVDGRIVFEGRTMSVLVVPR